MKRWHQEMHKTRRQWLHHLRFHMQAIGNESAVKPEDRVDCACDKQAGRFRKRRGRGCPLGARCRMCHGHKHVGNSQKFARRSDRLAAEIMDFEVSRGH